MSQPAVSAWISVFAPRPTAAPIEDPRRVAALYRHFRVRVLYATFIGYALYYFCRKNLPVSMSAMGHDLGFSNTQLGILGSVLYVTYGVGKFINGILGDHADARRFMALGLLLTAAVNLWFGTTAAPSLLLLAGLWGLNGWVQSMGFPPCARLLASWYSVSERGLWWGLWNASHQVGAALIAVLAGWLLQRSGWRSTFVVPGLLCVVGSVFLWERLRDTPRQMGLPGVALFRNDPELDPGGRPLDDTPETIRHVLIHRVLSNPRVWLISLMNLFVYLVRSGVFDWAPKLLIERKGTAPLQAGAITSLFEWAGIAGALLSGVISDRLYQGRRAPVCALFLLLSALGIGALYAVPPGHPGWDAAALALIGFAIYGPQFVVGVFATDLASPKAAATAIGLTGVFGYAGSALSGVGTGLLLDRFGWAGGCAGWAVAAVLGALVALPLWSARPGSPGTIGAGQRG